MNVPGQSVPAATLADPTAASIVAGDVCADATPKEMAHAETVRTLLVNRFMVSSLDAND
jgi:hypothetical protein